MSQTSAVSYTASGAALISFAMPFKCVVVAIGVSANQTSPAPISFNGISLPSSGVSGSDGALIAVAASNSAFIGPINVAVAANQLIYIDVKVAATFTFYVERQR